MEDQIRQGMALGLDEICFTDHVDYGIKKDWDEGDIAHRGGDGVGTPADELEPLANVDYPRYFDKFREMDEKYGDRITLRRGLEFGVQAITIGSDAHSTKYLADHMNEARAVLRDELGFEVVYTFRQMHPVGHKL